MRSKAERPPGKRFETLNLFVDNSMSRLTAAEVRVWFVLYRDAKPPHWRARASVADVAGRAGVGRRSVMRAVKALESKRLLRVVKRGGLNTGPSTYEIAPYPMF